MKKFIILAAILCAFLPLRGQDTIYNRCDHYMYSNWYDTCWCFFNPRDTHYIQHGGRFRMSFQDPGVTRLYAKPEYASEPVAIQGIAVMEAYYRDVHIVVSCADTGHRDEYTMLYKWNKEKGNMETLDSVRWDTVPAKIMKLPLMSDTGFYGFATCNVHETFFDSAIIVADSFFLGGTGRSNYREPNDWYPWTPTAYVFMLSMYESCGCETGDNIYFTSEQLNWQWQRHPIHSAGYGMFMPIVYYADLGVESADSTMGSVTPSGRHSIMVDQTIRALPGEGYRFSHWNDGNTANPRIIRLMQDTLFTAYFVSDTVPDDTTGGGTTGGTEFILLPDGHAPAFRLSPNPAIGTVNLELGEGVAVPAELTVCDASGKDVLHQTLRTRTHRISGLPSGIYFVTLATPQGGTTQKLVVK